MKKKEVKSNIYLEEDMPSVKEIADELARVRYHKTFSSTVRNTVYVLIVVAAFAVLTAIMLFPVLRIYGNSMNTTLSEGDIVVTLKGSQFETGDVIAFYYNNKVLVKRVIANAGDWVDIDEHGNVYVNQQKIDEPYIKEQAFGETNIKLPYQIPENKIFVMGDNRSVSIDSRNTAIGCVSQEQIVGKIFMKLWPLASFGVIQK